MGEEEVYKCIKELRLPKYDEDEYLIEGEFYTVPVDSEWELQEHSSMSDVRLESNLGWIEIALEDLKSHFIEI